MFKDVKMTLIRRLTELDTKDFNVILYKSELFRLNSTNSLYKTTYLTELKVTNKVSNLKLD